MHGVTIGSSSIVNIRRLLCLLLLTLSALSSASAFPSTLYSRKSNLPPLLLTYKELQGILDATADLVSKANEGHSGLPDENIILSDGKIRVRMNGHRLLQPEAGLLENASSFSYTYASPHSVITDVEMVFSGSSRSLYVAGHSREEVEAIFTSLEESLMDSGSGGISINEATKKVIAKFFLFSLILSTLYCVMKKRPEALGMPLFSLAGLVITYTLPFELSPGFTVCSGKPPFMVSYGPQISLAILLLVIAGIPLSYFIPKIKEGHKH